VGGGASLAAYAMVMWAFSKAPIAVVMAVRETSILFAILIGIFFLKEKITLPKIIGSSITLFGIFLLRAS
jgi:drug/metabolite transporter (DMT)-like permease